MKYRTPKNQQPKEFLWLKDEIESSLKVDITTKSRKTEVVMAKHVYYKILHDAGYTTVEIGRSLSVHHATVLHYVNGFESYYNQSSSLRVKYCKILDKYNDEFTMEITLTKSELLSELTRVRETNVVLSSRIREYEQADADIKFKSLHKLINERTKQEQEEIVWRKINAMYNGI